MTSLGLLGGYGSGDSGSDISNSDEELEPRDSAESAQVCREVLGNTQVDKSDLNDEREEQKCSSRDGGDPLNFVQGDLDTSSSSDDGDNFEGDLSLEDKDTAITLPLPDLDQLTGQTGNTSSTSSVFSNPYKAAEDAQLAILKRHVGEFAPEEKPLSPHSRTKHRKFKEGSARCNKTRPLGMSGVSRTLGEATPTNDTLSSGLFFTDDDSCVSEGAVPGKRKKRSGVSDTLVPPKKFMKNYEKSRVKERPWTVTDT